LKNSVPYSAPLNDFGFSLRAFASVAVDRVLECDAGLAVMKAQFLTVDPFEHTTH
jgi:hypothetical protein